MRWSVSFSGTGEGELLGLWRRKSSFQLEKTHAGTKAPKTINQKVLIL